jgi:hypothetical protein
VTVTGENETGAVDADGVGDDADDGGALAAAEAGGAVGGGASVGEGAEPSDEEPPSDGSAEAEGGRIALAAGPLATGGVGVALPPHPTTAMARTAIRPDRVTAFLPADHTGPVPIPVGRIASA